MDMESFDPHLKARALAVLDGLPSLRLTQARWRFVAEILCDLLRSLDAGDRDAVHDAVVDLESGTGRAEPVDQPETGPDDVVLDLHAKTVHALTGSDEFQQAGDGGTATTK